MRGATKLICWIFFCSSRTCPGRAPRGGAAARYVHVDRHDLVDAVDDVVAVEERPAAGGAGAHPDDPLGLGHLVVEAPEHGGHLLVDGAGHDHEVALPRRGTEDLHAEARDVEPSEAGAEHLDGAAGEAVGEGEDRVRTRPVEDQVGGGGDDVGLLEALELRVVDPSDPLERSLPPCVGEPYDQHRANDHHLDEARPTQTAERERPREQEDRPRRRTRGRAGRRDVDRTANGCDHGLPTGGMPHS